MSIHFLDWLFFAPPTFSAPWPLVDWHAWGHTAVQMKILPNENKRSSSWIQTQMVCGLPLAEYHGNKHMYIYISSSNLPVWCSFLMVKNSFAKARKNDSNVSTNSSPESRCGGPASPASTLPLMRRRALATQIAGFMETPQTWPKLRDAQLSARIIWISNRQNPLCLFYGMWLLVRVHSRWKLHHFHFHPNLGFWFEAPTQLFWLNDFMGGQKSRFFSQTYCSLKATHMETDKKGVFWFCIFVFLWCKWLILWR